MKGIIDNMTTYTIAERIIEIGKRTENHAIRCTISELVTRSDVSTYNNEVKSVNKKLKEIKQKPKLVLWNRVILATNS